MATQVLNDRIHTTYILPKNSWLSSSAGFGAQQGELQSDIILSINSADPTHIT